MSYQTTARYRSLSTASSSSDDPPALTRIDGMDVVDEQVVVLSPLEVGRRSTRFDGRGGEVRRTGGAGDGVG
jgi:hypothetical protein